MLLALFGNSNPDVSCSLFVETGETSSNLGTGPKPSPGTVLVLEKGFIEPSQGDGQTVDQ